MSYLLPISFLGPIKYYAYIVQKKDIIIESKEYFIKQTLRNRCLISNSNGIQTLTIPKKRKSSDKTIISEIKISNTENWKKKHLNSLTTCYNSSPYFQFYIDDIIDVYSKEENNLFNFNINITNQILKFLEINKNFKFTSNHNYNFKGIDLRGSNFTLENQKAYHQVFSDLNGFTDNLSIIDLVFNIGPGSREYLENIRI